MPFSFSFLLLFCGCCQSLVNTRQYISPHLHTHKPELEHKRMTNNLVVAVVGYTGGVGTCLLKAMKKMDLKPYALVSTLPWRR
jgi:hypothetical protein